jgi:group I intron endonuclease
MGLIYKLTSPSGKSYIGMTLRTIEQRMKEHNRSDSKCTYLVHAITKYGSDNFTKEILWEGEDAQTPNIEREMISKHDTLTPNGYNLRSGGGQGERISEELRENFRMAQREATKTRNNGLLGSIEKIILEVGNSVRYRLHFTGKHFGTFKTLEECKKVQINITNQPDKFLLEHIPRKSVCIYENTQSLGRTVWQVAYKGIYLGTWLNKEIPVKVRHYILERDKNWDRKELINALKTDGLNGYLPEVPDYKNVSFNKEKGNWRVQFKLNGKNVWFGQWRYEQCAYYARDCIKDNNINSRNELISHLKSNEFDDYLPIIRPTGTVYLLTCDNTWLVKVTIDGKQVDFGRRKTEKEARELLNYILDMGFTTKKEMESSLPKKQTGSRVYFIKNDHTWGIKVPINGKPKSFGQCKTKEIGWGIVDYIRDKSIETKQQLLDSLKSDGLVEYLEQYLPKIKRTGRVRKMGNIYQAILRGKYIGSFKTEQEAEYAITTSSQHPPYSTSSP